MDTKYIWDSIMSIYLNKVDTYINIESFDNYFLCSFMCVDGFVIFSIDINYKIVGDIEYEIKNPMIYNKQQSVSHPIGLGDLSNLLTPVLRDIKLDTIGI